MPGVALNVEHSGILIEIPNSIEIRALAKWEPILSWKLSKLELEISILTSLESEHTSNFHVVKLK